MGTIRQKLNSSLESGTYLGLLRAYSFAGIISAGPWTISILSILLLGSLSLSRVSNTQSVEIFLVSVTYLVSFSLILSGLVQLVFSRYVADKNYLGRKDAVLPRFIALLAIVNVAAALLSLLVILVFFRSQEFYYQFELYSTFILLNNIWILTVLLAGIGRFYIVFFSFLLSYLTIFVLGIALHDSGLNGLLGAFLLGNALLFFILLFVAVLSFPTSSLADLKGITVDKTYVCLGVVGFLFNLAIWADKFIFWFNPITSMAVLGPMRASPVYDFPMFLAYLSIIPGLAVFFIRMETDFSQYCTHYYNAILNGEALDYIEEQKSGMIVTAKQGIYDIFKLQGAFVTILIFLAPEIIKFVGFSVLYVQLFIVDIVAVAIQLLLLSIINILFYLDKVHQTLYICIIFLLSNISFTLISQWFGVSFYGYGFAISLLLSTVIALFLLSRSFEKLTFNVFMK